MQIQAEQVAVITGGCSGIGYALATQCACLGLHVVLVDIDAELMAKRVAALEAIRSEVLGTKVLGVVADISEQADVERLAEQVWARFGACHLLFNNAGVSVEKPLDACQDMDWQWLLGVNVRGVGNTIAQFLPRMRASGAPCHIINTASMAGLVPLPGFGAYVASKYAVLGLSEVLHAELAGSDVGVSIVCPGVVDTHIFESAKHRPSRYDTATDVRAPASADVGSGEGMETDFDARYQRMLSPEAMAAIVLDGVRQDSLYILSHPEWQPLWDARQQQVTQAFKRCHHDPIKE